MKTPTRWTGPAVATGDPDSSPITLPALMLVLALALIAYALAAAGRVSLVSVPNPAPLVVAALLFDVAARLAPASRIAAAIRNAVFAILYLSFASISGVVAAYAGQRLQMPLQDDLFARVDHAIGFDWGAATSWIDAHASIADVLRASYETMSLQILAPALLLSFTGETRRLQTYLLAFTLALAMTAAIAAALPALSPIAAAHRDVYHYLKFTGATPLAHLMKLRSAAPVLIDDNLGGIISFPSFHASVAILTPIALARHRMLLLFLVPVDALMLCAAVSEGAHYACDVLAGGLVAVLSFAASAYVGALFRRWRSAHGAARDWRRTDEDQSAGLPLCSRASC